MKLMIDWFLDNPIAVKLILITILVGGVIGANSVHKEVFPTAQGAIIEVAMVYPGASPSEVERQICVRIEQAIADLSGIEELTSEANLGFGLVRAQFPEGYDATKLLNEIKTRVDSIDTFPDDAERPNIQLQEHRPDLMFVALYGDVDEKRLKASAEALRDSIALVPGVARVFLNGLRADEVGIEVSEDALREYNLTFDFLTDAIRGRSLNVPAGKIRSDNGDIQIQTRSQAYSGEDFSQIPVISRADGTTITLEQIAHIKDSFEETDSKLVFNGQSGVVFRIVGSDYDDVLETTRRVRDHVNHEKEFLPEGMNVEITFEMASIFADRIGLLLDNAILGLLLVFIVLMLFMRPMLALWICAGIVVTFSGVFFLLPFFEVSLNMMSLFAFLLVLGIVVDDAIIVGESIYSQQQKGIFGQTASSLGAINVSKPVLIAVISTIIFFLPLSQVPDSSRPMTYPIVAVIVLCLLFSLLETLFILPSHLKRLKPEGEPSSFIGHQLFRTRRRFALGMEYVIEKIYEPLLQKALNRKGATITGFIMAFIMSIGVIIGGWITPSFMPVVPNDYVDANISLPDGSPRHYVQDVIDRMTTAAEQLKTDPQLLKANKGKDFITQVESQMTGSQVRFYLGLKAGSERTVSPEMVARRWRELAGEIPEAIEYRLDYSINAQQSDISLNLGISSDRFEDQQAAAMAVTSALKQFPGVFNVRDGLQGERAEIEIKMKPHAETMGIHLADIAKQVRQGFFGEEIQRIPRRNEDVKVMLRYPLSERTRLDQLNEVRIRTNAGHEIALEDLADIEIVPGYTSIKRVDRKRNIHITADVETGSNAQQIAKQLNNVYLGEWKQQFPGFSLDAGRGMRMQQEFVNNLLLGFLIAVFAIYALMAVSFRSYLQSFIVLTAIPFGFMGAVIGHLLVGVELSMMSMLGFVACAGVVVNDNLVLVDRINQLRKQSYASEEIIIQAAKDRFRPIALTSLTTFIGLLPILFEQSVQAQFLIPMVVSLSYGVLVATLVTLFLVPSLYLAAYALRSRIAAKWSRTRGITQQISH